MKSDTIRGEETVLGRKTTAFRCFNLRYDEREGVLQGVKEGHRLADLHGEPVFTDRLGDQTAVLSMDPEGYLIHDVSIREEESFDINSRIGKPSEPPTQCCRAGDFLVTDGPSGEAEYMIRDETAGHYRYLGILPGVPFFRVIRTTSGSLTREIAAVGFQGKVSDLRNPGAEIREPVSAAVRKAYLDGVDTICGSNFTGSVAVRVCLRLYDGEILDVSDPILGAGLQEAPALTARLLPVSKSGYYTGTSAGVLTFPTYTLDVSIEEGIPEAWQGLIREVEIWVSEPMGRADGCRVSVGYDPSGERVTATCHPVDSDMAARRILNGEYRLAVRLKPEELPCVRRLSVTNRENVERPFEGYVDRGRLRFHNMTSHGGFLHCSDIVHVYPTPRLPFLPDPQGEGECRVSVLVKHEGAVYRVENRGRVDAPDSGMQPYFHYGADNAVEVTISLRDNEGRFYEEVFQLGSAPDGSGSRCWYEGGVTAHILPETESWSQPEETIASSRREPGKVVTMKRGNPFVVRDVTSHCGASVKSMCAQPMGGGAYTRQYLYLFTDSGVIALTHDNEGHHCVCRPISGRKARGVDQITANDSGVWFMSTAGELLRLNDARLSVFAGDMEPDSILSTDSLRAELIIADPYSGVGRIVRIRRTPDYPLSYRTTLLDEGWNPVETDEGVLNLWYDPVREVYTIRTIESRNGERAGSLWQSRHLELKSEGETLVLFFGNGKDMEITVRRWDGSEQRQTVLARATCDGPCRFPLLLPEDYSFLGMPHHIRVSFEVMGEIHDFDRIEIIENR